MTISLRAHISSSLVRARRTRWPLGLAAALALAAAVSLAPAQGEAAAAGDSPAAQADGLRPVAVIDREEIASSGARDVSDLLLGRLSYNAFGLHRPFVLDSERVAVLVNGRHISDSTLELNTLPTSAVERVEILSGGAPALHGGHAIAGAVNIVLRRDYEGVEASAFAGRPTDAGGDTEQGTALWGGAVGSGHMTVGTGVFRSEEIPDAARAHSRASWAPGGLFGDAVGVSIGGNTVFIPTASRDEGDNILVHVPGAVKDGELLYRSIARPLGDCPTDIYTGELAEPNQVKGTGCGFPYADVSWGAAQFERESLFFTYDQPLDGSADTYLDVRLGRYESLERFAPSVGTFSVPSDAIADELLPDSEIASLPERVTVAHRFIGHGNREWRTEVEEYDVTLGLAGQLSDDVSYDTHMRYYRHDSTTDGSTFVSESLAQNVIDEGRYDLANPLSPANREAIEETSLRLTRDQMTEVETVGTSLDGPLFALGGGEAQWTAGIEVAAEDWSDLHAYRDREGVTYEAVDVLGAGGIQAAGDRLRGSAFAELSLPVRDDWEVVVAGRGDEYDDVNATFSHQLASRFRVSDAVSLRGAWDRGSRPPSLYALHLQSSNDFPYVCDRLRYTGPPGGCPVEQHVRVSSGNRDLDPDKAESFSLGVAAEIAPLSLSADWFRIALHDVPSQLSPQSILDLEARGALPEGVEVVRLPSGIIDEIRSPIVNSLDSDTAGVDVRARLDGNVDWADIVLEARWLHLKKSETYVLGERQPGDFPRNRAHGSLRATRGDVTVGWDVLGVSSFSNVRETGRFEKWIGHDLTVRWHDAFGLSGMDLRGGVLNVADRGPSVDPTDPDSVSTTQDSLRGRTFFLSTTVSW